METLKLQYYELIIRYHQHTDNYLEICRCYKFIYDTPSILADAAKWTPVLKNIIWCRRTTAPAPHFPFPAVSVCSCLLIKGDQASSTLQPDFSPWDRATHSLVAYSLFIFLPFSLTRRNVVLAPNGTEQVTLLNNTVEDKKLNDMPEYKQLLNTFITNEASEAGLSPAPVSARANPSSNISLPTRIRGAPSL